MIEYGLARFILWSVRVVPSLASVYVKLFDVAIPRLRRAGQRNLEIAGIPDDGMIDRMYQSIARMLAVFASFPHLDDRAIASLIQYDGFENFENALNRGRGVLIPTAHFGNWELSAFAHARMYRKMNVVVRPLDNRRVDALVERWRGLSGNNIISKRGAARDILRALQAGEAVGILIDQNTTLDEGVFVDFFGVKACAGSAFVKLAHHSGAAVVPGYAVWDGAKYALRFDPEIPMTGDVLTDTQAVHSHLERVVRQYPDQYLWIHRRWKTRPPGEPPLY